MTRHNLTPRFILEKWSEGKPNGRFQAATLFVDISGFTTVTESLMAHGKVGAEILADVMAAVFSPLITAVYEQGGFITGFAGDAFTAVFPGRGNRAKSRAVAAANRMQTVLTEAKNHTTPFGDFTFSGRVGVAAGQVNWGVLGADGRHTTYFRGRAIDRCAQAEHLAHDGEVILSSRVAMALGSAVDVAPLPDGRFFRLNSVETGLSTGRPRRFDRDVGMETAVDFHPESLLNMGIKGEFRQVVAVFLNVKGNPRQAVLAELMRHVMTLLSQFGGTLCRLDFGDKGCNLLLFWGAPTSHENDIERALNFLLELQRAVSSPIRAGVTYRQAFAGFAGSPLREEYTCYGLSINQSARQMMAAPWGSIWLDEHVARRADGFRIENIGSFPFKGFAKPQTIHELSGRRERHVTLFEGVFAGRSNELGQIQAWGEGVRNGRFGGIFLISGEAGIGKSRLVHQFITQLSQEVQIAICQTDEILRQPLNPFRYWLRRYFDQSTKQVEATNKQKFDQKLLELQQAIETPQLASELERTRSFLGALVNLFWSNSLYDQLEPRLRFENTLAALKSLVLAEAQRQPLLLLIEDAQWLDEESRQFLQRLPHNVGEAAFGTVLTSRTDDQLHLFDENTAVIHLPLTGMAEAAWVEMASRMVGGHVERPLFNLLQERAEGNPFFLEQLILYLKEQNLLIRQGEGVTVAETADLLPQDVQAVLVARLDRLSQEVRDVVQTAAVLGREFEVRVLSQMLQDRTDVAQRVSEAEEAAVWQPLTELLYLFKHSLLRESAYGMQLKTQLRRLHKAAAESIKIVYDADLSPQYANLAYHFRYAEDIENERLYAFEASEQAASQFANREALAYLERVYELTSVDDVGRRFELLEKKETHLSWIGEREGQALCLDQMEQLAGQTEAAEMRLYRRAVTVRRRARLADETSRYDEAVELAKTAVALAEQGTDTYNLASSYGLYGRVMFHKGAYDEAKKWCIQASEVAKKHSHLVLEADNIHTLGLINVYQGYFAEATTQLLQAQQKFHQLGNHRGEALSYNSLGLVARKTGDRKAALENFTHASKIFQKIGLRWGQGGMQINMGLIAYDDGHFLEANRYFTTAFQISREINSTQMSILTLNNKGLCSFNLGNDVEGENAMVEALALAETSGEQQLVSVVCGGWGGWLLEQGQVEKALKLTKRALKIVEDIGKRDSICSMRMQLALILCQMGDVRKAEKVLNEVASFIQELESVSLNVEYLGAKVNLYKGMRQKKHLSEHIIKLLEYLEDTASLPINEILESYAFCLGGLAVLRSGELTAVAKKAYAILKPLTDLIPEGEQRERFLHNVPAHRDIIRIVNKVGAV